MLVLLLASRRRSALLVAASGLLFLPTIVVFWNTGYGLYYSGGVSVNPHPVALRYATHAWSDSILLTPVMVGILVAPAIVGIILLSSNYARAILVAPIVATVATYTFYDVTPIHPRFFYVVLPQVLVLASVALVALSSKVHASVGFPITNRNSNP